MGMLEAVDSTWTEEDYRKVGEEAAVS